MGDLAHNGVGIARRMIASVRAWASLGLRPSREGGVSRAALGGAALAHLAFLAAVFLALPLDRRTAGARGTPRITVVLSASNGEDAPESRAQAPAAPPPSPPAATATGYPPPPADAQSSASRLDRLFGATATSPSLPATRSRLDSLFGRQPSPRSASKADARATAKSAGAARPMTGLEPGESLGGVDLYATASLPPVGPRPNNPSGDLWGRIRPCWRPTVRTAAELVVEIGPRGELIGELTAIHRQGAGTAGFIAERSAVRAAQACAPYTGVSPGKWRVSFG